MERSCENVVAEEEVEFSWNELKILDRDLQITSSEPPRQEEDFASMFETTWDPEEVSFWCVN